MARRTSFIHFAVVSALALLAGACTVHKQETPSLSGPSELGKAISITVSPDVLAQDGASQSLITVTARDANGQPLRNLSLRADVVVNGVITTTLGSLSAHSLVTDANGRATSVFTAPMLPAGAPVPAGVIQIAVRPIESDFANSVARTADLRLVLPPDVGGVPPPSGLVAKFTFSPTTPTDHQTVVFDGTTSSSQTSVIVSYLWNFGDGASGSGPLEQHSYSTPGTYPVTLTVTDALGGSASTTQTVTVGQGQLPTATFTVSPSSPIPNQNVFFNASASRPAPGRTLVSYAWDFGDGSSGSSVQTSHAYATAGSYTVTLVVTDDAGHTAVASQTVAVSSAAPTADFVFSPTAPTVGTLVNFNASASRAATGRSIVSYSWSFGDGASGTGVSPSHSYLAPGTYNVILTVVDDQGNAGTITKSVTVS